MNPSGSTQDHAGEKSCGAPWLLLVLALLVPVAAISNQSLWIDETLTACKAQQPTFAGWWHAIVAEKASDLQMPLYMIYMWAYEKVFGSSEWILRAANLPWFAFGMFAFGTALSSPTQRRSAATLVVVLSPFAWYYLNEARPYAMQLGASLFIFAALKRLSQEQKSSGPHERFWVVGFLVAIIVLCSSSMLGTIWAASAVTAAVVILSRSRTTRLVRSYNIDALIAGGSILLLGVYYLWTLAAGARASASATTDWKSPLFIGYELLGFSGLGPGRLEIREGGLSVFQSYWLRLALYGFSVLTLLGVGLRRLAEGSDRQNLSKLVLIIIAPAMVLITAGLVMHFRVLGRHFTPVMPVLLFLLSTGAAALWSHRSWLAKLMVCTFFGLSLASCLSLRFAARHEKDDYRSAAAFARAALQNGKHVWWNADNQGAAYYRIPTTNQPDEIGKAWWVTNPSRELLAAARVPEVIIVSKPDLFDNQRALAEFIARSRLDKVATLPAFTIWHGRARRDLN